MTEIPDQDGLVVHCCGLDTATLSPLAFATLASFCCDDESARAGRFLFDADRRAYLAAHGLVRYALSAVWPQRQPGDWGFRASGYGKPYLDEDGACPDLRVNLSHSRSRVVCVVAAGVDCGIDVEPVERPTGNIGLYSSCLTAEEATWLESRPEDERSLAFLKLWTLKEAITKSIGLGLHLPFERVALDPQHLPRLRAVPDLAADRFWLRQTVGNGHVEALSVIRGADDRRPVIKRQIAFDY